MDDGDGNARERASMQKNAKVTVLVCIMQQLLVSSRPVCVKILSEFPRWQLDHVLATMIMIMVMIIRQQNVHSYLIFPIFLPSHQKHDCDNNKSSGQSEQ